MKYLFIFITLFTLMSCNKGPNLNSTTYYPTHYRLNCIKGYLYLSGGNKLAPMYEPFNNGTRVKACPKKK